MGRGKVTTLCRSRGAPDGPTNESFGLGGALRPSLKLIGKNDQARDRPHAQEQTREPPQSLVAADARGDVAAKNGIEHVDNAQRTHKHHRWNVGPNKIETREITEHVVKIHLRPLDSLSSWLIIY